MLTRNLIRLLVLLMSVAVVPAASAQSYSNQSLNGVYAFGFDGTIPGPGGIRLPIAGIERFVFDGMGDYTAEAVVVTPGPTGNDVVHSEVVGTYTVRPDGTFTATQERFLASTNLTVKLSDEEAECVLVEGGKGFRCLAIEVSFPGLGPVPVMTSGHGRRQTKAGPFDANDLRGNHGIRLDGTVFVPDPTAFRDLGTFFFDGVSKVNEFSPFFFNTSGVVSVLPPIPPPGDSGTYTVDDRGFVNMFFNVQDPVGTKVGEAEFTCLVAETGKSAACINRRNALIFGGVLVDIPTVALGGLERLSPSEP